MKNNKVKQVCLAGLMAAMVFVFTFTFKIPIGPLGYAHLGDAFIIIAVWILGGKQAWFPAALGAALADFAAGYVMWIVPTAIVKTLMAVTIFLVLLENPQMELISGALTVTFPSGMFQMLRICGLCLKTLCSTAIFLTGMSQKLSV